MRNALAIGVFVLVAAGRVALAAGTPEQACQGAKNQAAGSYAACRQKAEKGLATSGDKVQCGDHQVRRQIRNGVAESDR